MILFKKSKTRYKKEQVELPQPVDVLKKYINKPFHYIHFSSSMNIWESQKPIWGLNVKSQYDTPIGIYGYPITTDIIYQLDTERLFMGEAKAAMIFKAKDPASLLIVQNYNLDDLNDDTEKLINMFPESTKQSKKDKILGLFVDSRDESLSDKIASRLFYILFHFAKNKYLFNIFFRKLGYSGVHDSGYGVIHPNEPAQAVFFSTKDIEVLDIIKNPKLGRKELKDIYLDPSLLSEEEREYESIAWKKQAMPIDTTAIRSIHDTEFREAVGKDKVIVYHGTSSKQLALIVQHGSLDPEKSKQYKTWEHVTPGIYVTRQLGGFTGAWLYANHTSQADKSDPVVLELVIPLKWIEQDPDDTRINEKGEMGDLGENQGIVHRPISIKNIKGVCFQGEEVSKLKPGYASDVFETNKTEWLPFGDALRLIFKNKNKLPQEYQDMVGAAIPKGMSRGLATENPEHKFANGMECFYVNYIGSPSDRFNGKSISEIALIWFLKNRHVLWGNATNGLISFGKIIGVDFAEALEYIGEDNKPKKYETLASFLKRI